MTCLDSFFARVTPADVRTQRLLVTGVLLLAWLLFWWGPLSGETQLFLRDLTFYALPMKTWMMSEIQAGRWPLWSSALSAGMPFLADPSHQLLYPLNFLFALTPTVVQGITAFVLLHHLLALLFSYRLARVLAWGRVPSVGFSLLYGFCGYVLSILDNVNYLPAIVWVPLALACWFRFLQRKKRQDGVISSVSLALMVLAGDSFHPTFLVLALAAVGLLLRWKPFQLPCLAVFTAVNPRGMAYWAYLAVGVLLTLLLSAAQLLPTLELTALSVRREALSFQEITLWSFPPQRLIEWFQPFFYGSKYPVHHFIGQFLYPEFREPWVDSIYIGLLSLPLLLIALIRRRTSCLLWLTLMVLSLLFSFGKFLPGYDWLIRLCPLLGYHRYLEKFVYFASLFLLIVSGEGLQYLWEKLRRPSAWCWPLWEKTPWVFRLFVLVGVLFLLLWLTVDMPALPWIWGHAIERAEEWGDTIYDRGTHVASLLLHTSVLMGGVLCLGLLKPRWRPGCILLLMLCGVLDGWVTHWRHFPEMPSSLLLNRPAPIAREALAQALPSQRNPRIFYDDFSDIPQHPAYQPLLAEIATATKRSTPLMDCRPVYWLYRVLYNQQRLLFNYGMIDGVRYLNGRYAPLQPQNHQRLDLLMLQSQPARYMRLMGVDAVVTSIQPRNPAWDAEEFKEIYRHDAFNLRLLAVQQTAPRAYVLPQSNVYLNADPNVYRMVTPDFATDPLSVAEVAVEADPLAAPPRPQPLRPSLILWKQDVPGLLSLTVQSPYAEPSWLVITEGMFPGWQASVDDRPALLQMANHRWMALLVPPGEHQVRLSYQCVPFVVGLGLSVVGLLLLIGLLLPARYYPTGLRNRGAAS
ncbi:MAG: hypothetical protein SFZ03_05655 [Candidatus Melainabacteria bacterium]|nr:hypothetical protein [Candidatus Melainabacteria bacterium]